MDSLKRWKKERKLFVVLISIISIIFYMSLPLSLSVIPHMMNKPVIGVFSWAWIYAFLQVLITWLIGWIYWVKAKQLDKLVDQIKQEAAE